MRSPKCRKGHLKFDTGRRRERRRLLTTTAIAAFSSLALMPVSTASAQQTTSRVSNARSFDIPSQPLSTALNAFGRQSGLQVTLAASTSQGLRSATVSGTMTADQALARLLSGTGISYRISGGTALVGSAVSAGGSAAVAADGATVLDPISAFGAGPLGAGEIVISSEDLKRKNPANIADVFSGEPGISVGSSLPMSQKVYVHGIEETSLAVTMDGGRQNNKVFQIGRAHV